MSAGAEGIVGEKVGLGELLVEQVGNVGVKASQQLVSMLSPSIFLR